MPQDFATVHDVNAPCGHMLPGDEAITDPEEQGDVTCEECRRIADLAMPERQV